MSFLSSKGFWEIPDLRDKNVIMDYANDIFCPQNAFAQLNKYKEKVLQ